MGRDVRTDDKNRDGRPDVWRVYDRQGQLATMTVDTNFDGRSDVHEYFAGSFVVKMVGSYTNVVGLPLTEVVSLLQGEGFPVSHLWLSKAEVETE